MENKQMSRRGFLGAGAVALLGAAGCSTLGIENKFEGDTYELLHKANSTMRAGEKYQIVDNVLYVAMPRLEEVLTELGMSIPKWNLSSLGAGDTLSIRWPGESELRTPKIAGDFTIDTPYGERVSIFDNPTMSKLDEACTLIARRYTGNSNACVEIDLSDPNQLSGPKDVFVGSVTYYQLSPNGQMVSGLHILGSTPMPLGKLVAKYNLGQDAKYLAVAMPIGNGEDIRQVVAITDMDKCRMQTQGYSPFIINNDVIIPLGRNFWNETRRFLQQIGGLGNDVRGITGAVNLTITDLNTIETQYDHLTGRDKVEVDPLKKAVDQTGLMNQYLNNTDAIREHIKP